ncbi:hypothetical protein C0995_015499 [Termitomyces sp. Mi166|nr:hypothetical protein C0995_015499 [Termitomyces sp. Mi166\
MGKVHGSLARAGKVKSQTPKVEKQEKKKTPKGRAKKRILYNRRFVNVTTLPGGKRRIHPLRFNKTDTAEEEMAVEDGFRFRTLFPSIGRRSLYHMLLHAQSTYVPGILVPAQVEPDFVVGAQLPSESLTRWAAF